MSFCRVNIFYFLLYLKIKDERKSLYGIKTPVGEEWKQREQRISGLQTTPLSWGAEYKLI